MATLLPERPPGCAGTVAYAFLTRSTLPLWPAWKRYFDGCPAGSFTVLVHTQRAGATLRDLMTVGGGEVVADQVVHGNLRFSYNMIDAMLRLYAGVHARGAAPNGCVPAWVHLSSDVCAPVRDCRTVHADLRRSAGRSFVQHYQNDGEWKTSQWMTLWAEHAFALARDRAALRAQWSGNETDGVGWVRIGASSHAGALDEFVWPKALSSRGLPMHLRGLTYVDWGPYAELFRESREAESDPRGRVAPPPQAEALLREAAGAAVEAASARAGASVLAMEQHDYPVTFATASAAAEAVAAARAAGKSFARKFAPSSEVLAVLKNATRRYSTGRPLRRDTYRVVQ